MGQSVERPACESLERLGWSPLTSLHTTARRVRDVGKTGRVGASRLARALYTQSLGLSPAGSKPNSLGCCLLLVCCTPEPDQKIPKAQKAYDCSGQKRKS